MATPTAPITSNAPSSTLGNINAFAGSTGTTGNSNSMASSSAIPSASSTVFVVGEKVLCYHGPLIYEAKILQVADYASEPAPLTGQFGMHYFVHYKGWKRTWDEWVHSSRLLKINDENLAKQKATQASHQPAASNASGISNHKSGGGAATNKSGGVGISARAAAASRKDAKSLKRARDEGERTEEKTFRLNVPEVLKQILVDDWENVTKRGQGVDLPAPLTVVNILDDFSKYIMDMDPKPEHLREPEKLLDTVVAGLKTYFDKALGTNLLYRPERNQLAKIRELYITGQSVVVGTEPEMSEVYGAEHLLRMLVSLPTMLVPANLDRTSLEIIKEYSNELIQYMAQERARMFPNNYLHLETWAPKVTKS